MNLYPGGLGSGSVVLCVCMLPPTCETHVFYLWSLLFLLISHLFLLLSCVPFKIPPALWRMDTIPSCHIILTGKSKAKSNHGSSLFSFTVINNVATNYLEKRGLIQFTAYSPSLSDARAGIWRQELKQKPGFLCLAFSASFLMQSRTTCPGGTPSSHITKMSPQTCL